MVSVHGLPRDTGSAMQMAKLPNVRKILNI